MAPTLALKAKFLERWDAVHHWPVESKKARLLWRFNSSRSSWAMTVPFPP